MILIENETISHIPALHVVKEDVKDESSLPVVFVLHGFRSAKEDQLPIAYLLAERGFRVILPDAQSHGKREDSISRDEQKLALSFWNIVMTSIKEMAIIKESLEKRQLLKGPVAIVGTSMGAITLYGALTQYEWISSAVAFMGAAHYEHLANEQIKTIESKGVVIEEKDKWEVLTNLKHFDLTKQINKLNKRPLWIWHGLQDQVIPFFYSEKLYETVQDQYENHLEQLAFIREERAGHKVSRKAMFEATDWLRKQSIKNPTEVS
ncbi:putative hydrolase [Bacillus sp. TS-2]|nr:putative hydrolase [Bacillus sp. TS-2]